MRKKILITGAILGLLAVILGAFGAHALKKVLTVDQLASFETGVRYQMYHAFFLLFVGMSNVVSLKMLRLIYVFVLWGILLFSGSIYLLATKDATGIDITSIGFITPIGGALLIIGWITLGLNFFKLKTEKIS
ncbi:uncharacterized membrane protein YgdD (TMEM256/DUF423 family) [Kordia periserrulae]|uniref:Uncharacterized membrane protein YgdD (TMEM256/DUF423 family) n=1 Tax=Kordia periserrulae TaxID=701523 RepID=A0A2T6BT83_9FLAO|nr:DUF423 domain-containing protein [Kordia periserrulae]PTX59282.1 uncharacterized membrane protein YgdD (TMEM256/DUF423 family) [Kordia periserrulae]